MALYTFVMEFKGNTYLSQADAANEYEATRAWIRQLDTSQIDKFDEQDKENITIEDFEDDDPASITGLVNTWCFCPRIKAALTLIHFCKTEEAHTDSQTTMGVDKHNVEDNVQHLDEKSPKSAKVKYEQAKVEFNKLRATFNKPRDNARTLQKCKKQIEHWKNKIDNTDNMALYTFIMGFQGGTYLSQVYAVNEYAAIRTWIRQTHTSPQIVGFDEQDKEKLIIEDFEDNEPVLISGFVNTWCIAPLIKRTLAMVHFIKTDV